MRVTISEVNGPLEAIFAAGLKQILVIDGVTVDCPSSPGFPPFPASPEREAAVVAPAIAAPPVQKNKPGRKPGKAAGNTGSNPVAAKAVSSKVQDASLNDPPRLTQRQRVAQVIRSNQPAPTTAVQICRALALEPSQVANLLWAMKAAGEVVKDDTVEPTQWRLA